MGWITSFLAARGQKRHGFQDGYEGKQPSTWRTSLIGQEEPEMREEYEKAYRLGLEARRNDELAGKKRGQ